MTDQPRPGTEADDPNGLWDVLRRLCLWSGVLGGFVAVMSLIVLPLVADAATSWLPRSYERSYSRQVERDVIADLTASGAIPGGPEACQAPAGINALARIFRMFAPALPEDIRVRATVLKADIANAVALPGDRLIIFSGLLERADHPNAFAGVIAHELGHLAARHPLRGMVERSYGSILLSLLVGEKLTNSLESGVSGQILFAANTREMEREADQIALKLMQTASLDSTALAGFLAGIAKTTGTDPDQFSMFETHPSTRERIDAILNRPKTGDNIALGEAEWRALKNICAVTAPHAIGP